MTLFDYYLQYMQELFDGKRKIPEGLEIEETDDQEARMEQLSKGLAKMGIPAFVKACAEQDGLKLPSELFENFSMEDAFKNMVRPSSSEDEAQEDIPSSEELGEDPDKGKHPFEILLDCCNLDDDLISYLIDVLKRKDKKEFFKISQITTKMDLDPDEFLYWLGNKELYASDEERDCAITMDHCMDRLFKEKKMDVIAALISGDQKTFETFRMDAPELQHLPIATFEWYAKNYLDRDYPIRIIMKIRGVEFPHQKEN